MEEMLLLSVNKILVVVVEIGDMWVGMANSRAH